MRKGGFVLFITLGVMVVLVVLGIAVRPILGEDKATDTSVSECLKLLPTEEREKGGLLSFDYNWELTNSPNHTLLLTQDGTDIFSLIQPATWKISCHKQGDHYTLQTTPPLIHAKNSSYRVHTHYLAEFGPSFKQRHPDGSLHPVHTINLVCELWIYRPFFQKPLHAFAIQEIKLDFIDGSADLIPPYSALLASRGMQHRFVKNGQDAALPGRYCGSDCERLFTRLLFMLASIDHSSFALSSTPDIISTAQNLLKLQTDTTAPWPNCWGEDAIIAKQVARRIIPTLVRFQENDCYNHQALTDFINGPDFGRIFGENFSSTPTPLPDMPPIIFERADNEKN